MGFLFDSLLLNALAAWCIFVALLYVYAVAKFDYWRVRGVKFVKPVPFFGNVLDMTLLRTSVGEGFRDFYKAFAGERFVGLFQARAPTLLVRDPALARDILVRDFDFFQGRGVPHDARRDPLTAHLLNLEGAPWRRVRRALSPAFTPAKLRAMLPLIARCAAELTDSLSGAAEAGDAVDVKEAMARFSSDVIGTCAFGLHFNSMRDPDCEFRRMGQRMFRPSARPVLRRFVRLFVPAGLFKALNLRLIPRSISDFFVRTVVTAMAQRQKQSSRRPDFLQALVDIKTKGAVEDEEDREHLEHLEHIEHLEHLQQPLQQNGQQPAMEEERDDDFDLSDEVLAAQAFAFFLAGFETSASMMAFCLLELAAQPPLLLRARREVDEALAERAGRLEHDALDKMPFLDWAMAETLRKYPPSANLVRVVSKPYTLEGTAVTLDTGVRVVVPVYALHHDPEYWPEPATFDPLRFAPDAKHTPFTYLPFGDGPRICIGQRFGLLQAKAGLAMLLSWFDLEPCARTPLPVRLDPATLVTNAVGGVWLRIRRRHFKNGHDPAPAPAPA